MAPKSLMKTLKYKPRTQLNMDDVPVVRDSGGLPQFVQAPVPPPHAPEDTSTPDEEGPVFPPPTPEELATWSAARALQTSLPNGQPTEGWPARLLAMKSDGRLMEHNGVWYRR